MLLPAEKKKKVITELDITLKCFITSKCVFKKQMIILLLKE